MHDDIDFESVTMSLILKRHDELDFESITKRLILKV